MVLASLIALVVTAAPATGIVEGRITIGPLSRADHIKNHTHFDKAETVLGFAVQFYRPGSDDPVATAVLQDENGKFSTKLPAGKYRVEVSKDMYAGAFARFPHRNISVHKGHTTHVVMHVRSEYF
jgi:hypothetical protein